MKRLESVGKLAVSQKKEWGEILSGFEGRNKYVVSDERGNELFYAVEEPGSVLARLFLKAYRPFAIDVLDRGGKTLLRIERPFRFYFHSASIFDGSGKLVGRVERQFSVLRRLYSVLSNDGNKVFDLFGPLLHPWTFKILEGGRERGMIQKKWTGLLKESFTDADNFGVTFPSDWPVERKTLALGAVFLIDFVHFENKGNR
ncbi:MAG: scramblase [Gemmatimonadetes bacterium]|nr:scramblase [Gemmatimonadota bacterium]